MQALPTPHASRGRRILFGLMAAAALLTLVFAFQGTRGIFSPDEGFYVEIGRGMAESGDFLIPRLQDEPWLDKPPLSLWGIAAGLRLIGWNEWGARTFHAVCFALTILMVFLLGRSMGTSRDAWLAAIFYATMPVPFAAANIATPDAPLALWTTAAFLCFWESVKPGATRAGLWKVLMSAAFGLGFLTKGPAALVPSAGMFAFLLLQRRVLRYFWTPWFLPGIALFLAVGLGWYAWVAHELPGALDYFLDNQLIGRTVSAKYARNPGLLGALIYVPVILGGTLPWSFIWWQSLHTRRRDILRRPFWSALIHHPPELLLFTWATVPLLLLSVVSSKLPLYVLPLFPALALITARLWPVAPPAQPSRPHGRLGLTRTTAIFCGLWMLLLLAAKLAFSYYPMKEDMRSLEAAIRPVLPPEPYEIISVNDHLEALSFYDVYHVERVSVLNRPYPFFVMPRPIREKIANIKHSSYAHVFLCREAWQQNAVRRVLREGGISCAEFPVPFQGTHAFVCPAVRDEPRTVRLVAVADPGIRRNRRQSVASALHLLDVEKHLNGGVILMANPENWGLGAAAGRIGGARPAFHRLFADLLACDVPFYTVPDEARETSSPASPRQPSSSVLPGGLVEVFFPAAEALSGNRAPDPSPDLLRALRHSRATWKMVARAPFGFGEPPEGSPPPERCRQAAEHWPDPACPQIVLQGNRCEFPPPPRNGPPPHTPPSPPVTGPDPAVAFRLLEFLPSRCQITAFDVAGRPLASFTLPLSPGDASPAGVQAAPDGPAGVSEDPAAVRIFESGPGSA